MAEQMPLIILEGKSGTGKSTLANLMRQETSAIIMKAPKPDFLITLDNYFNSERFMASKNTIARFAYHISAFKALEYDIIRMINEGRTVILDRYILTTIASQLAFDFVYNNTKDRETLLYLAKGVREDFSKPDAIVYLTVDEAERRARMLKRLNNTGIRDLWHNGMDFALVERCEIERELLLKESKDNGVRIKIVDTTKNAPDETKEGVLAWLEKESLLRRIARPVAN